MKHLNLSLSHTHTHTLTYLHIHIYCKFVTHTGMLSNRVSHITEILSACFRSASYLYPPRDRPRETAVIHYDTALREGEIFTQKNRKYNT